jgi:hypothetical protein
MNRFRDVALALLFATPAFCDDQFEWAGSFDLSDSSDLDVQWVAQKVRPELPSPLL